MGTCCSKAIVSASAPNNAEDPASNYAEYSPEMGTSVDKSFAMTPMVASAGVAAVPPVTTLSMLFKQAADGKGSKPALLVERPCPPLVDRKASPAIPVKDWNKWTYAEYYQECRAVARAFIGLGLAACDAVAIYGFNAPEWHMAEMAAILAGGVAAGIYPTDTPAQVEYKALHSGAVIACVESLAKAKSFDADALPKLRAIVVWDPDLKADDAASTISTADGRSIQVVHWRKLKHTSQAEAVSEADEAELDARIKAQQPGAACAYIYTSGTTGSPKAVMITHDNIVFEATSAHQAMVVGGLTFGDERIISYLPLSHVAGMLLDIVLPLFVAAMTPGSCACHFARNYDLKAASIVERFQAVRPTIFLGVPRVWEKIAEKMMAIKAKMIESGELSGAKLKLSAKSADMNVKHQYNCQLGGSGAKPFPFIIAEKISAKAKDGLGLDQVKFAFTGAAPISVETLEYFAGIGININEVYGMSECTGACTWSTDRAHLWGSCGFAMPGVEVKVFRCDDADPNKKTECPPADDVKSPSEESQGELCYRGRNVMLGYMANPDLGPEHVAEIKKKTSDAIDAEGWLHSGDKGCMNKAGMFKITGRYKELLIGAGGENIAPVPVEDAIKKLCPALSNVMMVGDKRPYNCALVTLKCVGATGDSPGTTELDGAAASAVEGVASIEQASASAEFIEMIRKAVTETNTDPVACPNNASKVQKFTILPIDFSVETDEFTPTLKLKRSFVHDKYIEVIDKMYDSKEDYVPFGDVAVAPASAAPAPASAPEPVSEPEPAATEPVEEPDPSGADEATELLAESESAPEPVVEEAPPPEAESVPSEEAEVEMAPLVEPASDADVNVDVSTQ